MTAQYKRVVLKLSGESFAHAGERGISMDEVVHIATQIRQAFYGQEAQRVQRGRDDVKVMVRYPEKEQFDSKSSTIDSDLKAQLNSYK